MSRIRESVAQEILDSLGSTSLGRANFEVNFPKTGRTLMKIYMRDFDSFRFEIGEAGQSEIKLFVHEYPGAILKAEIAGGLTLNQAIARLVSWADRLPSEISASKKADNEFERLIKSLEAEIEQNVSDPSSMFSADEVSDLRSRLNKLTERFEHLQEENRITKTELKELKKQIARSATDLQVLPRGAWYRSSISKIVYVLKKIVSTKEGREFLASSAKKLLGLE